jgi:hypothetical protein
MSFEITVQSNFLVCVPKKGKVLMHQETARKMSDRMKQKHQLLLKGWEKESCFLASKNIKNEESTSGNEEKKMCLPF